MREKKVGSDKKKHAHISNTSDRSHLKSASARIVIIIIIKSAFYIASNFSRLNEIREFRI